MSQTDVARAAGIHRLRVVRAERDEYPPGADEVVKLAKVLRTSLEWLLLGRWKPVADLRGIAIELYRWGVRDLEVADPHVPGSIRHIEETIAVALQGDRPEPRVVEAMPFLLAKNSVHPPLAAAFADCYDKRIRGRLAWLADITLAIHRMGVFSEGLIWEAALGDLVREGRKSEEADSLGYPGEWPTPPPPIWRRWNVTYAGGMPVFVQRTKELEAAYQRSRMLPEG